MSKNVPASVWRRTSGNGELATASGDLVTLSGLNLVTLSGEQLVILGGSYTPIPATVWATVETKPASVWRKTSGLNENTYDGPNDIADPQGNLLVDTVGNNVVDTGIDMNIIPDTVWTEDDSK